MIASDDIYFAHIATPVSPNNLIAETLKKLSCAVFTIFSDG